MAGSKHGVTLSYSVFFLLVCLSGSILAQTFQYSRGWTNGKKRSNVPRVFADPDAADVLLICQMLRLREILAHKKRDQVLLPCKVLAEPDEEMVQNYRRKLVENEAPVPAPFDASISRLEES